MRMTATATLLMTAAVAAWAGAAFADPPAHAPAHGWRKKHDPYYVGYTGVSWERDYEISSGRDPRTSANGPSSARNTSASTISFAGRASR